MCAYSEQGYDPEIRYWMYEVRSASVEADI